MQLKGSLRVGVAPSHRPKRLIKCSVAGPSTSVRPSSVTASTELDLLSRLSVLVPDELARIEGAAKGKNSAATVSFSLLRELATGEAVLGMKPLENAIAAARNFSPDPDRTVEKAMANVGAMLADQVEGRVSNDLDPRLAHDAAGLVLKAKSLVNLYKEMKIPTSRLLMRVPATWAGIQACKELEAAGIPTHVYMVYSLPQAAAAGGAGASLVATTVGRTRDWFSKHPGAIRDPMGPRQDAGGLEGDCPGVHLAVQVYNYLKLHHPKTQVMATSVRSRKDALALAGYDYLLLPPKVMADLASTPTTAGYNDGLHLATASTSDDEGSGVPVQLTVEGAKEAALPKMSFPKSEAAFMDSLGLAGQELLKDHLAGSLADVVALAGLHKATLGRSST